MVHGTEGLVVGRVIWLYGCEKMVLSPKELNLSSILPDYQVRFMASEEYLELTGEKSPYERDFPPVNTDKWFGKKCRDKVTGIKGICIACTSSLFSADQYALEWKNKKGKSEHEWFDEGRLEIIGDGVTASEVASPRSGGGSDLRIPHMDLPQVV